MANALYPIWKSGLLQATSNTALTGTVKAALVDTGTYTYSAAHDFHNDVSSAVVGTPQTIDDEPQATPGYSRGDGRSHRYRVRVGKRWIEVDPLDDASLWAVYIAAEQEAQKAAESRVAAPRRSAARVVAAAAPKAAGVDYAAVRAEAQRISEMVRAVYAEALQRELIGRLMREQIERDDEDDIELLLMV